MFRIQRLRVGKCTRGEGLEVEVPKGWWWWCWWWWCVPRCFAATPNKHAHALRDCAASRIHTHTTLDCQQPTMSRRALRGARVLAGPDFWRQLPVISIAGTYKQPHEC